MKDILRKIADILYYIPNMNKDCMGAIMNPIDTIPQAKRLLNFLEENKDDPEIMQVTYLLRNNHKIIGN